MVEVVDAVVAEEVGVGEDDDAAAAVLGGGERGADGSEAVSWVRATTRAPLVEERVPAR